MLRLAILGETGRSEFPPQPGLLEAAPFRLRDVRTVVVDPLRAQVQRDLWPNQWGARIQFAERWLATYTVRIADASITKGAPDKGGFLALYERDGRAAAVLSVDRPPSFMRARRELARGASAVEAEAASR